jgi:hypothetical protein
MAMTMMINQRIIYGYNVSQHSKRWFEQLCNAVALVSFSDIYDHPYNPLGESPPSALAINTRSA